MANRRCFSKEIVCSDDFYDLPISSQALYFHLGMQADDRGYVNNARSIIKIIGSSVGDLEALITKKFVLARNNNLILIKGWRINNSIQPSRLIETNYTDDLKTLFFDENNSYTENETLTPCQQSVSKVSAVCQQSVNNMSTQYNLIKDNISKVNIIKGEIKEINQIKGEETTTTEWTSTRINNALYLQKLFNEGIRLGDDEMQELNAYCNMRGIELKEPMF